MCTKIEPRVYRHCMMSDDFSPGRVWYSHKHETPWTNVRRVGTYERRIMKRAINSDDWLGLPRVFMWVNWNDLIFTRFTICVVSFEFLYG